jgi:hypothetical protein
VRNVYGFLLGVLIVLILALTSQYCSAGDKPTMTRAPVVRAVPGSEVLLQTGWYTYEKAEDVILLYCVERKAGGLLACVGYVVITGGSGIVMVDGVEPTERSL